MTPTPAKMGVNLTPPSYWTPNGFIDILKTSGAWSTYPGSLPIDLDPNGYPRAMPTGASMVAKMVYLAPASAAQPVLYDLTTDGEVTAQIQFATIVSSAPGRITFSYTGSSPNGVQLILRAIRKAPTYMRLTRADETALLERGETWRPEFLAQLRGFAVLRFMDWMRTNGSTFTDAYPANVAAIDYIAGVPIAVMRDLCTKVGARGWFCVPATASDALIQSMISAAPDDIWEPSNEVWNKGFPQGKAAEALGSDGKGAGGGQGWYGGFAVRVAKAARGTGASVVLGWQTAVPSRAQPVWDAVKAAGGQDSDFGGWIIATYVNGSLTLPTGPVLRMAANDDVAGALDNIWHSRDGLSVDTMAPIYAAHGVIARAHGLPLMAYEGGFHLNALPHFAAHQPVVIPFYTKVQRDPGSQAVAAANVDAFEAAGGSLNVFFNLASPPSGGGYYGIIDTPTFTEARRRMDVVAAPPPPPVPDFSGLLRDVRAAVDRLDAALAGAVRIGTERGWGQ